jgi:hypothetical protein
LQLQLRLRLRLQLLFRAVSVPFPAVSVFRLLEHVASFVTEGHFEVPVGGFSQPSTEAVRRLKPEY